MGLSDNADVQNIQHPAQKQQHELLHPGAHSASVLLIPEEYVMEYGKCLEMGVGVPEPVRLVPYIHAADE